ncbi:sperm flagellar protein 1-like isoform X2 [Dreissena polymorpha]|uniref:sperm flagellar protein 1-like isoform X2 n=1 Tax=Dreissena polymorpha TaxID=45954 RepID=UPI002264AD74|nr:sperm flagellar protein 1-like isoform X2 [Dreissena polymorpha]
MPPKTKGGKAPQVTEEQRVQEKMEEPLDEQELESLYAWVDGIPLSRPKRNISRDFADGVLVAEIMAHFFPQIVDKHNYSPANNSKGKQLNWETLNRRVFSRLNFELAEDVINDLVACKPGMIEKVLLMLQVKIKRAEYARGRQNDKPEADQHHNMSSPGRKDSKLIKVGMEDTKGSRFIKTKQYSNTSGFTQQIDDYGHVITHRYLDNRGWNSGNQDQKPSPRKVVAPPNNVIPKRRPGPVAESDVVPRYVIEEKEQEVLSRDETIQILQAKISRLEHLLHLKDMRIDDLQNRVEATRPTGVRR